MIFITHLPKKFALWIALIIASIAMYGAFVVVDAVDIHSTEKEQQILSEDQTILSMTNDQIHDVDILESEANKTREYVVDVLESIEKFEGNAENVTLNFDLDEAINLIDLKNVVNQDIERVIYILDRASNKGSEVIKVKVDVIKKVFRQRVNNVDEHAIEEFTYKTNALFVEWLRRFGVTEDQIRSRIKFDENHKLYRAFILGIGALHALALNNNPKAGATFALNHLSIFESDELIVTFSESEEIEDDKIIEPILMATTTTAKYLSTKIYPNSWSLVDQGIIGPVLNQGSCTASYAFAATQALEGLYASQNNKTTISLSPQQIIDCDEKNNGCKEGSILSAWNYIHQNKGISTSSIYPFRSANGKEGVCQSHQVAQSSVTIPSKNFFKLVQNDAEMEAAVYSQPVIIKVGASNPCFTNYKGGILNPMNCNCGKDTKQALLVVGWGIGEYGEQYWIVKNSLGTNWGMNGYGYIARLPDDLNYCGMYSFAVYPTSVARSTACDGSSPPSYCDTPIKSLSTKLETNLMMLIVSSILVLIINY